ATYIGGCASTACAIADREYGIPAVGTMAHSWVQMFDSEYEAFKNYAMVYPDDSVFLIDTYNVLKSGVPNAIRVANEVLIPQGKRLKGVRIDSGDIAYLSKKARLMLDEAGMRDCKIMASNSLDEYIIRDLLLQGAQVDSFGVGENMITSKSDPVFGGVYKLAAVEKDGVLVPKIKISETIEKITTPCFKNVYRFYNRETGQAIADYVTVRGETVDDTQPITIFDPVATWKRKTISNFRAECLLVQIFEKGRCVYDLPALGDIRAYCAAQVDSLWDEVKRFEHPHRYYVDLSDRLWRERNDLLEHVSVE
ncbi:MAG: nicotinate phosphoribosyltransferase, partial [Anaerotruncus colihominis]